MRATAAAATPQAVRPQGPRLRLRPHACVASLFAQDRKAIVQELARLPKDVDVAEVRLDALWPTVPQEDPAADDLLAIVEAAERAPNPVALLATLRPARQGGRFSGPEEVRLGLLAAAAKAGFHLLDVEVDAAMAAPGLATMLGQDAALVFSHHEPSLEAPCRSDGLDALRAMQDLGGAFDKYAFTAGAFPEALRALEFVRAHAGRGGRPCVSVMGYGGAWLRALAALVGNRATYGHAPGLPPAVRGQPSVSDELAVWRHWGLSRSDLDHLAESPRPWLAVLGTPVEHSLSPRLHNAALRKAGRPERYGAFEVPASPAALRLLLHVAPRLGMVGASVTAPHKTDAARIAQGDAVVQATGAANCLKLVGEAIHATNTDATAIRRLLKPHVHAGDPTLVLGAGGAARAAVWALRELGAAVTVSSRDPAKAAPTATAGAAWVPWDQRAAVRAKAVVQATPLRDESALPASALSGKPAVVEMVYAGGPTALERQARAAGCAVVDGRTVLLEQAVDAYAFWFGQRPDFAAMGAALAEGAP